MMKSSLIIFAIACYAALSLTIFDFSVTEKAEASPNDLVVHEWGTFTTVSGKKGTALDWRPLSSASDLPTFVYRGNDENGFRGSYDAKLSGKDMKLVKVRMETPVIYFYTKNEMEIEASVGFPDGEITEWYPQASIVNKYAGRNQRAKFTSNLIDWGTIKLLPNGQPNYPREAANSHYYPARETDAVAVQVCNFDKTKIEKEKFLFYRGVGDFGLALSVRIDGKNLFLKDSGTEEVKNIIVFENRGGRVGFKFNVSSG